MCRTPIGGKNHALPGVSTKSFIPASLRRSTKIWPSPEAGLSHDDATGETGETWAKPSAKLWKNDGNM